MILILTDDDDQSASQVERLLVQRGARFLRFNSALYPARARVSLTYSPGGRPGGRLEVDGTEYALSDFSIVWDRRSYRPVIPPEINRAMSRRFAQNECNHFMDDAWRMLDCRWLPAPAPVMRNIGKALQLKVAQELGLTVPPTLITNDPAEFLAFYREHNGRIISKVFHTMTLEADETDPRNFRIFSEIVSGRAAGYAAIVRHSPVIFQAYVPKRSELRITVVGRRVFAAEIFSQNAHHTRHDWRRFDLHHTPYRAHYLPNRVERCCVDLVERLGLSFGAIDMILTPDGRYVFLEVNPGGQWQRVQALTGLPIAEAICDHLVGETLTWSQAC